MRLEEHKNTANDYKKAKDLRNNASPIEQKLWGCLNLNAKARGIKFRRQHPVHPFIADFACLPARLLIEIDGDSHAGREVYDRKREDFLRRQGYDILRFSNDEVVHNVDGVTEMILDYAENILRSQKGTIMNTLSLPEAMAEVKARVKASGTSFAAGMRVLPKARREAMYALYAFCREVDDIADDSPDDATREAGLALWQSRIRRLFQDGKTDDAITTALHPAIAAYQLVEEDFQAIIEGMAMDARAAIIAPKMQDLDTYCDHVASAVGRASVRIFGDASASAMQVAYHLGRALQLTNILRDLAEDARRGRLYLPEELLTKHGITTRDPLEVLSHPALPLACRALADLAATHFEKTEVAMQDCVPAAMRPARIMRDYYHAILKALLKEDWKNPDARVSLPLWQKLLLAVRGLWR